MAIATQWHGFMPYQTWTGVLRDRNRPALDIRNLTSCGIFSLHHAMVFLGQGRNFQLLRSHHRPLLRLLFRGTDSGELVAIAKKHGLQATVFESWRVSAIRRKVDASLRAGNPVIIGSEPQVHWVCLGGRSDDGGYVWADSASDPVVGGSWSWEEIEKWMTYHEEEGLYQDLRFPFEIITIAPGPRMPQHRSMVPWMGSLWRILASDPEYAGEWSNLLTDMLDVFWDLDYAPRGSPAGEFLDEHLDGILGAVATQPGITKKKLKDAALAYRDAADFHNLVAPVGQETGVIASFSLKLAAKSRRWSCVS